MRDVTPLDLKIYNRHDEVPYSKDVACVDRGSAWGNPFIMHGESQRDEVCDKFEQYAIWRLSIEPDWLAPLRDKDLACWCAPKRCHAETLIRLANERQEARDE